MKISLILVIAGILLCFSSCSAAEATKPDTGSKDSIPLTAIGSEPIEPEIDIPSPATEDSSSDSEQPSPENGVVVSEDGEVWEFLDDPVADPEEMAKLLWYRANSLYDTGNTLTTFDGIKHPDTGVLYEEFYNYTGTVVNTFTDNEREKYEARHNIYITPDGNYYRIGPWATTCTYSDCLVSLELKSEADCRYTYKMGYPDFYANQSDNWVKEFSELEQTSVDMTIVFENGKWLVDSFTDPRLA